MMEDEIRLIERSRKEREQIFLRYDLARSEENEIDKWEDPEYEVYHKTDKFGFMHDERMVVFRDTVHIRIQIERELKWVQMFKHWNETKTVEKLQKRLYKGIPNSMRSEAWTRLLDVFVKNNDTKLGSNQFEDKRHRKKKKDNNNTNSNEKPNLLEANKNVYKQMLANARNWSTEARQIDYDVNRQFREHIDYRKRYSLKQKSLFNVLTAYSMYNMELGYCQGMAGVVGVLLMYMEEEQAFWALCNFMSNEKYAMHGLFIEGFPKLNRFIEHHDRILKKFLPKLHKHFKKHNLDSILYSVKWFFVIFVERIPFSLCLRVWDIYMIEGERVITAMAFTILRLHQNKLLKMKDMDLMTEFFQCELHKDFGYTDDQVMRALQQSMIDLKSYKLDKLPPPKPNEKPKNLGQFIEPDFDRKVGLRKSTFSNNEKETTEVIISRQDTIPQDVQSEYSYDNTEDTMAYMMIEDSSSILSTSIARTSIASTTNEWSDQDNHSNCLDDNMDYNQEIFIKTANEILVTQ